MESRIQTTHISHKLLLTILSKVRANIFYYQLKEPQGFLFVSDEFTNLIGYTPQEHYDNPYLGMELIIEEDKHLLEAIQADDFDFKEPLVLRWRHKNGNIIWTEQYLTLDMQDGVPQGFIGVVNDITDAKQLVNLAQSLRIPICAWCNRIKNDENKYTSVSEFLQKNEFELTHGICEECSAKITP